MANAVKIRFGTTVAFQESGGDFAWTPKNVASGAGRVSIQGDLGVEPRAEWYRWVLVTKFQTATIGNLIRLYLIRASTAAATYQDGVVLGTADAAMTTEVYARDAGLALGSLAVTHTTSACVYSGKVWLPERYVSVALWNASGVALTNVAGDHIFRLEPFYREVQ